MDLDNVICDTDTIIRSLILQEYGVDLDRQHVIDFRYSKCGIAPEQESKVLEAFHESACLTALPIPGAIKALQRLAEMHLDAEIHIVTGRPESTKLNTLKWLTDRSVPYVKLDFLPDKLQGSVRYDIFVDDNRDTAYRFAESGTRALLFDYPWNQPVRVDPSNLIRVRDWREIMQFVHGFIK